MKNRINLGIGFSDSALSQYLCKGTDLTVTVRLWNEKIVKICFGGVVGVRDVGLESISDLIENNEVSPFMAQVLQRAYETIPATTPYRRFEFLDLDDEAAMEIVAETYKLIETLD